MNIEEKLKDRLNDPKIKYLEVNNDEWQEILCHPSCLAGKPKPKPPVKSKRDETKYEKVRTGPISWDTRVIHKSTFVEYDYSDPSYLKAMDEWLMNSKQVNCIYFYGKKVVLKDEGRISI